MMLAGAMVRFYNMFSSFARLSKAIYSNIDKAINLILKIMKARTEQSWETRSVRLRLIAVAR